MVVFTFNLHHDEVVTRLVLNPPKSLCYCLPGTISTRGIRPLNTYKDMEAFIKVGFENGFKVELYTECYDYDVM
nr:RNA-directed DNA polymerase, eukaryota [Tanacetum cinerariifolium]